MVVAAAFALVAAAAVLLLLPRAPTPQPTLAARLTAALPTPPAPPALWRPAAPAPAFARRAPQPAWRAALARAGAPTAVGAVAAAFAMAVLSKAASALIQRAHSRRADAEEAALVARVARGLRARNFRTLPPAAWRAAVAAAAVGAASVGKPGASPAAASSPPTHVVASPPSLAPGQAPPMPRRARGDEPSVASFMPRPAAAARPPPCPPSTVTARVDALIRELDSLVDRF